MRYIKQRLLEVPFIHAVALTMIASATDLLIQVGPSPRGHYMVGLLAVCAFVGGLLILTGLQWRGSNVLKHGIERTGHFFAVAAWLIDAVIIYGEVRFAIITPIALGLASIVRIVMLGRRNKAIVKTVHEIGERHCDD